MRHSHLSQQLPYEVSQRLGWVGLNTNILRELRPAAATDPPTLASGGRREALGNDQFPILGERFDYLRM